MKIKKNVFTRNGTLFSPNSGVDQKKEVLASITLRNAHKENKRAKSVCSFAHFLFFVFKLLLGLGLDFEFGLGLTLGLDPVRKL